MDFTDEEKKLLLEVVGKLQVSPMQENAIEIIKVLQQIIKKLTT